MKQRLCKNILTTSMAIALGLPGAVNADTIVSFDWTGVFTMLKVDGDMFANGSAAPGGTAPNVGDDFGLQTGISGTLQFNVTTDVGTASMVPFDFLSQKNPPPATFKDISLRGVGDLASGPGSFIEATMLFDWNNSFNIPVSMILNGAGMFAAVQAGPLSLGQVIDGTSPGSVATTPSCTTATGLFVPFMVGCGPAPIWTTDNDMSWDSSTASWNLVSGGYGVTQDGASGTPMPSASTDPSDPVIAAPFAGFGVNFDFTTLTVTGIQDTSAVPVPAAIWLFGFGLVGLLGVARTRRGGAGAISSQEKPS